MLQCNLCYTMHIYFLACTWTILHVQSFSSPLYHFRKRTEGETDTFKGGRRGGKDILNTVHSKRVCTQQVWSSSPRAEQHDLGGEPRHRTMLTYVPRTCLRHCHPLHWRIEMNASPPSGICQSRLPVFSPASPLPLVVAAGLVTWQSE